MGVMPDIVKVIAVLVIAGIIPFDIVYLPLQVRFHSSVVVFRRHKVAVLGRIRSAKNAIQYPRKHRRAGRYPGGNHNEQQQRGNGYQNAFPMPCGKLCCLFCRFCGFLRRLFGVLGCGLCGFRAACPGCLCVLLLYLLFLPIPGKRVGRGKLRVIMQ